MFFVFNDVCIYQKLFGYMHCSSLVQSILVNATSNGSIGQLLLDLSIILFKYLASRTIFKDSTFRKMMTEFVKMLPVDNCSVLMGEILSNRLRISSSF